MSLTRVASIHFAPVGPADRSIYGGRYEIPAVALNGKPFILELEDKVQRDEGPISTGPGGGRRAQLRYHVDGYDIATDIVQEWAYSGRGMDPQCHPGIWIIRERMPVMQKAANGKDEYAMDGFGKQVFRAATAEEARAMWDEDLAKNKDADRRYAEWCYLDANRIAADARQIQFIPQNYRLAARQYGLQADWMKEGAALQVMNCPRCSQVVSKTVIICPKCTEPVDLVRYAQWEAEKAVAVRDAKKAIAA